MTAHRNLTAFPAPDDVDPARWTTGGSKTDTTTSIDAMKKLYMLFGKRRHNCAGQALAMLSMRVVVAIAGAEVCGAVGEDARRRIRSGTINFDVEKGCFLNIVPV